MSDNRNDLPPASSPRFLERVREVLSTYLGTRGDPLNRGLIVRDLVDAGMVNLTPGYASGRGGGIPPIGGVGTAITGAYEPELTPPPTPTGFAAAAAISNLIVECDTPIYSQGHGHARSILYGRSWTAGPLPVFSEAQPLTEFTGTVASYGTNPSVTWHLWLTWVTVDGVESTSPAGGTNGVMVRTGEDVSFLVEAMTGPGNPFTILAVDTVIDGVTFPAGTYTTQAFIRDAQITNAKIKNLAVDDAKIASLSAAKLTIGDGTVGGDLKSTTFSNTPGSESGWKIQPDGTATFNNAVVRGAVYASAGLIGGNAINSTGMQSPGYVTGVSGWRLDSSGSLEIPNGTVTTDKIVANAITTGKITVGAVTAAQDGSTVNYVGYPDAADTDHEYVHSNVVTITTTGVPMFIWLHASFLAENDGPATTVIDHFAASVTVYVDSGVSALVGTNHSWGDFLCESATNQAQGSLAVGFRSALAAGTHTLSVSYLVEPRDSAGGILTFGTGAMVIWGGNITCLENKV